MLHPMLQGAVLLIHTHNKSHPPPQVEVGMRVTGGHVHTKALYAIDDDGGKGEEGGNHVFLWVGREG